jgi:hypothetical protein
MNKLYEILPVLKNQEAAAEKQKEEELAKAILK